MPRCGFVTRRCPPGLNVAGSTASPGSAGSGRLTVSPAQPRSASRRRLRPGESAGSTAQGHPAVRRGPDSGPDPLPVANVDRNPSSSAARWAAVCVDVTRRRARSAAARRASSGSVWSRRQRLGRRPADEDLAARHEELVQPRPLVADDRHAARRRLEQPHARRPAGADHGGARHVQREALRGVERAVVRRARCGSRARRSRASAIVAGYCGPATTKRPSRQCARRLEQQALERGLPIVAVGAEIAEVPAHVSRDLRVVQLRVDRAVEGTRGRRSELAARAGVSVGPPVNDRYRSYAAIWRGARYSHVALLQRCQRDRRVDVVERRRAARLRGDPVADRDRRRARTTRR